MAIEGSARSRPDANGSVRREIRRLAALNRSSRDPDIERRLIELRLAGASAPSVAPPSSNAPRPAVRDPFPSGVDLPEVRPSELTADVLRGAILHHGFLFVRGLISPDHVQRLCDDIDATFAAIERCRERGPDATEPPWYVPFDPPGSTTTDLGRAWSKSAGTVHATDSPRTFFDLIEAFEDAGIPPLLAEFVGGDTCVAIDKCAVRRVEPGGLTGWHQDAYRFGRGAPVADVWVALSECGEDAPGLEILPRRLEEVVEPDPTAPLPWIIDPARVAAVAGDTPRLSPRFEPGDAIIFDEMLLHSTGMSPGMTKPRYGTDAWFFPAGAYQADNAPMVLF